MLDHFKQFLGNFKTISGSLGSVVWVIFASSQGILPGHRPGHRDTDRDTDRDTGTPTGTPGHRQGHRDTDRDTDERSGFGSSGHTFDHRPPY